MAVNVVQSAISSRRFSRWLFVVAAAVLAAGVIALIVTKVTGGSSSNSNSASNAPAASAKPTGPALRQLEQAEKNIRFPADAWKVVQQFVFSAASRENLARSYALADESMRGGLTLNQWKSGNIPVTYFKTRKVIRYNFKNTNFAHPREAALNIILVPPKNSTARPVPALIFVKKVGQGAKAHWLVDYFGSVQGPPVPAP
jgi:hypothetical protein